MGARMSYEDLNPNAQMWVDALRSGEYSQTHNRLRNAKPGTPGYGYCCLGVACDKFAEITGDGSWELFADNPDPKKGVAQWPEVFRSHTDSEDYSETDLTYNVKEWLGLRSMSGAFTHPAHPDIPDSLARMNDRGCSFEEIADMIESKPVGLFVNESDGEES